MNEQADKRQAVLVQECDARDDEDCEKAQTRQENGEPDRPDFGFDPGGLGLGESPAQALSRESPEGNGVAKMVVAPDSPGHVIRIVLLASRP